MLGHIYVLTDPRYHDGHENHIRYVGMTLNLQRRLTEHWYEKDFRNTKKNAWLRKLALSGFKQVAFEIVETVDVNNRLELCEIEVMWIAAFRNWGFNLTNSTDGGEGMIGLSAESRSAIGKATSMRMQSLGENHHAKTPRNRERSRLFMLSDANPAKSEVARKKMSTNRKGKMVGDNNPSKLVENRKKISDGLRSLGELHPSKRKERREEFGNMMRGRFAGDANPSKKPGVSQKISQGRTGLSTGAANPKSKAVICIKTGCYFHCTADAARWLKTIGYTKATGGNVGAVCAGKLKQCYNHTWRFATEEDTLRSISQELPQWTTT